MRSPSYAEQVVNALGQYLADHELASWDGGTAPVRDYTEADVWPIILGPMMPPTPDRVVVLTATQPVVLRADVALTVQIRIRDQADAIGWDAEALGQQISDLFLPGGHALSSFAMGPLRFGRCDGAYPQSIGNDTNRRPEVTLNLRFTARRVNRL